MLHSIRLCSVLLVSVRVCLPFTSIWKNILFVFLKTKIASNICFSDVQLFYKICPTFSIRSRYLFCFNFFGFRCKEDLVVDFAITDKYIYYLWQYFYMIQTHVKFSEKSASTMYLDVGEDQWRTQIWNKFLS